MLLFMDRLFGPRRRLIQAIEQITGKASSATTTTAAATVNKQTNNPSGPVNNENNKINDSEQEEHVCLLVFVFVIRVLFVTSCLFACKCNLNMKSKLSLASKQQAYSSIIASTLSCCHPLMCPLLVLRLFMYLPVLMPTSIVETTI